MNLTEQQMKELIKQLYDSAAAFDGAYIHSINHNGESSFTGEEYEGLIDPLVKAEELLGIS